MYEKIGVFVSDYSTTYGVKVIIEHVRQIIPELEIIKDARETDNYDVVIPYGIIQARTLINRNREEKTCALMVDALSLGMISDFKRMFPYSFIPLKFKLRLLARYFVYLYREYVCLKNYEHVMLVSAYDKKYFAKHPLFKRFAKKIIVIPNGVDLKEETIREKPYSSDKSEIRIGCLSAWNDSAFYTLRIFLDDIWKKVGGRGNMRLIVAGTKITPEKEDILRKYDGVEVMGFVDTLDEFFNSIDISLITFLKKCGILNKVLDSFVYRVPVLGRPQNFGAFGGIPDCFYTYDDKKSFLSAVERIMSNPSEVEEKVKCAYKYVEEHHNWKNNYKKLESIIDK